jgi:hypothetical protein
MPRSVTPSLFQYLKALLRRTRVASLEGPSKAGSFELGPMLELAAPAVTVLLSVGLGRLASRTARSCPGLVHSRRLWAEPRRRARLRVAANLGSCGGAAAGHRGPWRKPARARRAPMGRPARAAQQASARAGSLGRQLQRWSYDPNGTRPPLPGPADSRLRAESRF